MSNGGDGCMIATFLCLAVLFLILGIIGVIMNCLLLGIVSFCLAGGAIGYYFFMRWYMHKKAGLP
ncbi:MAG: hypothetical protein ACW98X_14590 [Promethearchaeota archaeon]|jgi:hypothetical protein